MRIISISQQECSEVLQRVSIGRLACSLNDQPYVVPVAFSYEPDCIYIFSTFGKKIEWMRKNPKVCLQADEIGNRSNWTSVIVTGTYLELNVPQYHTSLREHAREKLAAQSSEWWRIPLSGARDRELVSSMETVFFRIDIKSISGLRAVPEAEQPVHQGTDH
jgi:nitroimidazol reductase NimA-like FMN-containing flavoprotein (pyridoxamine 5'-phosphate oxidase superfamily)